MKYLLSGLIGAVLVIVLLVVIYPLYSDYRSYSETYNWLATMEPLKQAVEANAVRQRSLAGAGKGIDKSSFGWKNITYFDISDSGAITIKGGHDGQVVILTPSFDAEKRIVWHCFGGPTAAMPSECR